MSRYRWAILAVGVGAQMAVSALRQGLPALGPTLQAHFSLSLPQLGVILGSVSVGIVLTLIPWGALADRLGERPVISVGLAGTGAALAAAARLGRELTDHGEPAVIVAIAPDGGARYLSTGLWDS